MKWSITVIFRSISHILTYYMWGKHSKEGQDWPDVSVCHHFSWVHTLLYVNIYVLHINVKLQSVGNFGGVICPLLHVLCWKCVCMPYHLYSFEEGKVPFHLTYAASKKEMYIFHELQRGQIHFTLKNSSAKKWHRYTEHRVAVFSWFVLGELVQDSSLAMNE